MMLPSELNRLFQDEIDSLLVPFSDNKDFYSLIRESLVKIGQDSGVDNVYRRRFLPLIVCDAICDRSEHALPACTGIELLNASAEIFDDIEDADSVESLPAKYGAPIAINVGSTLIMLAERAFTRLSSRGVDSDTVLNLMDTVNSYYAAACSGQHRDLSLTPEKAATEDEYFRVIAMKSAFMVECACYTGASLAKANQDTFRLFIGFGHNLGMASQIANDIKGVMSLRDIRKRKITLPVIYALAQTDGETSIILNNVFCRPAVEFIYSPENIRDLLFSTGAIQYTTIKMELYKQQAADLLIKLEQIGIKGEQLQQFLI